MIVLAADYVGWKVVQILLQRPGLVNFLVCSRRDPGGFNDRIAAACAEAAPLLPILFDDSLADPEFLREVRKKGVSLGLLAWWPDILRGEVLSVPERGWINFHPSLLPYNRGKHPNFWCLVDETPCGVSLHVAGDSVDAGHILAQRKIDVSWEDTGKTVYERGRKEIVALFTENLDAILSGKLEPRPQDEARATFHLARELGPASLIDLDRSYRARDLLNVLRAKMFRPHPAARFVDAGKTYEVEVKITRVDD